MTRRVAVSGGMLTASMIATIASAGFYAVAEADALMPRRSPMPPPARDDAERIAAAEAKRARKNAKRAKAAPTTGEGKQ